MIIDSNLVAEAVKRSLRNPAYLEHMKHEILRKTGRNVTLVGDNGHWKLEVIA